MTATGKIKVCHVSTVHNADDDRIFLKECRSLAQSGYEVYFVVRAEKAETIEGVQIVPVKKRSSRLSRILFAPWEAYRKALKTKAKLIHFHDPELLVLAFWFRIAGRKVIFDSHENVSGQIMSKTWLGPVFMRWIISKIYRLIELSAVLFCNKVVGVIPEICNLFPKRKQVLVRNYPVLELAREIDRSKRTHVTAIYAGGLSAIRGIRETIRAVGLLEGQVRLVLLGKWSSETYKRECEAEAGWKYTQYMGMVSPEEVYAYYEKADIGVALLFPEPNYLRSLPVKAFEYMASGMPIVMSDFPYWKANFTEGVTFVNPKSEMEIAEVFAKLAGDEALRLQEGNAARRAAFEKYSWNKEFETLLRVYKELLSGN